MRQVQFALGFWVQAWFEAQPPKRRKAFLRSARRLLVRYRAGRVDGLFGMMPEAATLDDIERIADALSRLDDSPTG